MKHKYIFRTMTALCAALLIVGGLSVPAYAQTPEGQDATNDDNVIVEQPKEDTPPLTPEGGRNTSRPPSLSPGHPCYGCGTYRYGQPCVGFCHRQLTGWLKERKNEK